MEIPTTTGVWLEKADGSRVPVSGNCAFGRSSSCAVRIDDARASRQHATIHVQDAGEYWLIDLGSANGTQLNGRRVVRPSRLRDGDRISIVDVALVFHQPGTAAAEVGGDTSQLTVQEVRTGTRWLVLADIVGFTPLSQRLAPDALATLVGGWVRAGREIVERHGGTMNKYLGDGWLACWGGGDVAAVAAAVLAFQAQTEGPRFRIIVHHGEVSIGGAASLGEECLMGPEVNFVFRVEKVAGAAGVGFCFTAAAGGLLAAHLPLVPMEGAHELKGFEGSHALFRLV